MLLAVGTGPDKNVKTVSCTCRHLSFCARSGPPRNLRRARLKIRKANAAKWQNFGNCAAVFTSPKLSL